MSILRLDKESLLFGRDDDKDTYAEFFENEAKSSTRSRVQNFYRTETTSGPLTEFINPKSRTARSDQKYEALYRRLLDVCLLFFQEVRSMATQIANLQNKTTESVYHVCLKDILNWKKDTVDFWKVKCIARHKDFEYTFRLAFKKFMTDFYDDDDVFDVNVNTGIVIPSSSIDKKQKSKTPTIFYNIPDVGDFFYNVICFMTQLPDVKSIKVLTNQTSLESCVYHSMNESMLQMSKDVIRTMESREMVGPSGFFGRGGGGEAGVGGSGYDISDSVSVASKKSKHSTTRKKASHYSNSPPVFYNQQQQQQYPVFTTTTAAPPSQLPLLIQAPPASLPVPVQQYYEQAHLSLPSRDDSGSVLRLKL